ncbi:MULTISPECIES: SHOCT domain-containing protein [Bacillus amyloliquefaciens group]|uniref:SHOCT domain-containing protein n=1 Tax=Bacillus amyloliquefaciens group TaxID=1938374 RepID=UPI0002B6077A|nr:MULTISPECIES: SHOCT domain-containing protein [Bacillus amyloliquefaciens group]AGF28259.1 hypothetical protein KSO_013850 [Bacillus amyloliquefaciens IT-45]AMP32271.1 hypothetical protein AS588_09590 [Bacillus amyloliquefaciens]MBH5314701.1 SHOCT domain-containing protein [Bacillus velezensis]MDQ1915342.1 SHOCT domain-containing protein [Bacillus velezensis]QPV74917.1 SHOCT domain-containing protein [Bacillus velezensis]
MITIKGKFNLSFLSENGEVYNCQFKKHMKASKNFVKTYKMMLSELNETVLEIARGSLNRPKVVSMPTGIFAVTDDYVYFFYLKKDALITEKWPYDSILKMSVTKKALAGYRIDCTTSDGEFSITNITEGNPEAVSKYVESKITGNEEKFNLEKEKVSQEQKKIEEESKKHIKEYYFKSAKTTITLDGNYIRVARKGAVNTITRGYSGEKSYRISELSGLQIKKPGLVTSGYFQFLTPAANETSGLWDAIQDDNSFTFGPNELPMALEIQNYIEEHQSMPAPTTAPPAPAPTVSAADELKKYKELLDMDAITQEEYEIKKKQLLNL